MVRGYIFKCRTNYIDKYKIFKEFDLSFNSASLRVFGCAVARREHSPNKFAKLCETHQLPSSLSLSLSQHHFSSSKSTSKHQEKPYLLRSSSNVYSQLCDKLEIRITNRHRNRWLWMCSPWIKTFSAFRNCVYLIRNLQSIFNWTGIRTLLSLDRHILTNSFIFKKRTNKTTWANSFCLHVFPISHSQCEDTHKMIKRKVNIYQLFSKKKSK